MAQVHLRVVTYARGRGEGVVHLSEAAVSEPLGGRRASARAPLHPAHLQLLLVVVEALLLVLEASTETSSGLRLERCANARATAAAASASRTRRYASMVGKAG